MTGRELPAFWWRDKETLRSIVTEHGSLRAAAAAHGVHNTTLFSWWNRHDLPKLAPNVPAGNTLAAPTERVAAAAPDGIDGDALLKALKRAGEGATVLGLADAMDTAPRRVQAALTRLRDGGYRINLAETGDVRLDRVAPDVTGVHPNMLPLLDGHVVRFGVVSDTHLGSHEEALPELHAAYDWFEREGIDKVLHAGDWVTGLGIFPAQHAEVSHHTFDAQFDHLRDNYPVRRGVQTIGIAGNHDVEGQAARTGYDPVARMAASRDDVTYLGGMSAWLEVGAEQLGDRAPYVHLLHGKGGMSYAYSYKAQKLVDGYPGGRKPAILIPGHWHVHGSIEARSVQVLWPGCFEWQSSFMKRLGLHPAVGFHLVECIIGPDGSVVSFMPRWFRFYQGRVVG